MKVKVTQLCPTICDTTGCSPPGSSVHSGTSLAKNTRVVCHSLLQGIFPTQALNPGLPHCRQILYHLSHQESPWILEWVAYPFSRGSSQPGNETWVSCIVDRFFTSWATREAQPELYSSLYPHGHKCHLKSFSLDEQTSEGKIPSTLSKDCHVNKIHETQLNLNFR